MRDGVLTTLEVADLAGSTQWTLRLQVEHRDGGNREARFLLNLQ